jgi:hypothetical protein
MAISGIRAFRLFTSPAMRLAVMGMWLSLLFPCETNGAVAGLHRLNRLGGGLPIISAEQFISAGVSNDAANIDGPSVIRVPDWIAPADRAAPGAVYYLYFANHNGTYIRMAWASVIEGPWQLFNVGAFHDPRVPMKGVLDLGSDNLISFGTGQVKISGHIASPDVHVDDANHRLIMYFHGPSNGTNGATGTQKSCVATSTSGLNFNIAADGGQAGEGFRDVLLGDSYFRVFGDGTNLFAFSNIGAIWRAPNPDDPWRAPTNLLSDAWIKGPNPIYADLQAIQLTEPSRSNVFTPRHFSTRLLPDGSTLEVLYTARGDAPERIFRTTMSLRPDWLAWDSLLPHEELLRPQLTWEGANLPVVPSKDGPEVRVNELRDPYLFVDANGKRYLFYTGAGEEGIGVASMELDGAALDLAITPPTSGLGLLWNEYPGLRFRLRRTSQLSGSPAGWPVVLDHYGVAAQRATQPLPAPTDTAAFYVLEVND